MVFSLLHRLHCPVLENEWEKGGKTWSDTLLTVSVTVAIGVAAEEARCGFQCTFLPNSDQEVTACHSRKSKKDYRQLVETFRK